MNGSHEVFGDALSPFLTPDELRSAVQGAWVEAPADGTVLRGVGTDTRSDLTGRAFFALRGDRHDAHDHLLEAVRAGARVVVVEESRWNRIRFVGQQPASVLIVRDTRAALQAAARFWRMQLRGTQVVGITGSSGKTTTRRLMEGVLSTRFRGTASPKSFNNDVGVPITLLGGRRGDDFLLAEIGMNSPGEIAALTALARPDVGVITMVGKAHLGGLGSVDAILREKFSLIAGLHAGSLAIVRGDSSLLDAALEAALPAGVRVVRFGTGPANHVRLRARAARAEGGQDIEVDACGRRFEIRLALDGEHNAMNALAAIALGIDRDMTDDEIARGCAAVVPSDMRFVRQQMCGMTLFNDAYNANPDAMIAALRTFGERAAAGQRKITILGDMLELGDAGPHLHAELGRAVAAGASGGPPALAVFVGPLSAHGAAACRSENTCDVLHVPDLSPDSITRVLGALRVGDAILLKGSRGCRLELLLNSLQERMAA
ncbi:MAG: UDP-N-acetylmuramoyl-tripeptide--D-alanyl-D-alanine ligase [Planctomycetes bacterium]|nr:UDP-N-acetylmuramoyl-tripeptide--D-alanyl-D-alanine ligase [Planctomycetota bacterium]